MHHSSFWSWCVKQGLRCKHVTLRSTPNGRGLFIEEAASRGSVVISVPYMATLNRQCSGNASVPSIQWCRRLSKSLGLLPSSSEMLWLTLCVGSVADAAFDNQNDWKPYFELVSEAVTHLPLSRSTASKKLTPVESEELEKILRDSRKTLQGLATLQRRWTRERKATKKEILSQLTWAHDLVVSRSIQVPVGCCPSTPQSMEEYIDETGCATVPCIVPLVDCIDSSPTPNCELFTCEERPSRGSASGELFLRRKVVVCASEDIQPGQQLFFAYNTDDRPASVARFGFC